MLSGLYSEKHVQLFKILSGFNPEKQLGLFRGFLKILSGFYPEKQIGFFMWTGVFHANCQVWYIRI